MSGHRKFSDLRADLYARVPGAEKRAELEAQIVEIEETVVLRNIGDRVRYFMEQLAASDEPETRFVMVYDSIVYGFTVLKDAPVDFGEEL